MKILRPHIAIVIMVFYASRLIVIFSLCSTSPTIAHKQELLTCHSDA